MRDISDIYETYAIAIITMRKRATHMAILPLPHTQLHTYYASHCCHMPLAATALHDTPLLAIHIIRGYSHTGYYAIAVTLVTAIIVDITLLFIGAAVYALPPLLMLRYGIIMSIALLLLPHIRHITHEGYYAALSLCHCFGL